MRKSFFTYYLQSVQFLVVYVYICVCGCTYIHTFCICAYQIHVLCFNNIMYDCIVGHKHVRVCAYVRTGACVHMNEGKRDVNCVEHEGLVWRRMKSTVSVCILTSKKSWFERQSEVAWQRRFIINDELYSTIESDEECKFPLESHLFDWPCSFNHQREAN